VSAAPAIHAPMKLTGPTTPPRAAMRAARSRRLSFTLAGYG